MVPKRRAISCAARWNPDDRFITAARHDIDSLVEYYEVEEETVEKGLGKR
jgi:hypothetical protein